jgi:hypothetical protein
MFISVAAAIPVNVSGFDIFLQQVAEITLQYAWG